ncbi:hypothetical protein [Aeromicrobium sp. UC242_57]|uniref:hypothetical protein n=1 Tax=Aeromicrobium sp. UC242_57 TaxID=3374624 RepID=UPI0037B6040E
MVLGLDFLIASDRAVFADTHASVGILPGGGMSARRPARWGFGRLSSCPLPVGTSRLRRLSGSDWSTA